ncbi:hypothetical protein AAY473_010193 [Plecturocebus cupreus]
METIMANMAPDVCMSTKGMNAGTVSRCQNPWGNPDMKHNRDCSMNFTPFNNSASVLEECDATLPLLIYLFFLVKEESPEHKHDPDLLFGGMKESSNVRKLRKVKCHPHLPQVMSPTRRTPGISDKANKSPQNTPGQEGNKDASKATVERTRSGNCYNYVNLNLAMAEAVNDTPLPGEKVPLDHFNDHKSLCHALRPKDATSRAAGPWSMGLGMGTDLLNREIEVAVQSPSGIGSNASPGTRMENKATLRNLQLGRGDTYRKVLLQQHIRQATIQEGVNCSDFEKIIQAQDWR